MKLSSNVFAAAFLLLLSQLGFSQVSQVSPSKSPADLQKAHRERAKNPLLADINSLKPKDQAVFYVMLSDIFWEEDRQDAVFWLNKAAEIALNPATEYRDSAEKVYLLRDFFYSGRITAKDESLANRLRAVIQETLLQESRSPRADEYRDDFLRFAGFFIKSDQNLALTLAFLSLDGKKPVLYPPAVDFLINLKSTDEALANRYFLKLVETLGRNNDQENLGKIIDYLNEQLAFHKNLAPLTDEQQKLLYGGLITPIQTEIKELLQKTATDCYYTRAYGKPLLNDLKRLLPAESLLVEQSLRLCQAANIEDWRKPEPRIEIKTSAEALAAADSTTDELLRRHFLYRAVALAKTEKNPSRAIEILDAHAEFLKSKYPYQWDLSRNNITIELISEQYKKQDFAAVRKTLENSPPHLRPYIFLNLFTDYWWMSNQQMNLELVRRARAELRKTDFPPPTVTFLVTFNPAKLHSLVLWYARRDFPEEALDTFAEYIDLMNRLAGKYAYKNDAGETFSYFYYGSLPPKFVGENFDRLFEDAQKLESTKARLHIRLMLLDDLRGERKWGTQYGPIKLN